MRDYIRELVYSDKIFQNPILGKVSCGSFNETLTACKQNMVRTKAYDPCFELRQATEKCYSAKNNEQINSYIMAEFEEALMMIKFLQNRQSTIPAKFAQNSWALFTNSRNLELFEKLQLKNDKKQS